MRGAVSRTSLAHAALPEERRWRRWGLRVFIVIEPIHFGVGLLVNDWEGWGTFFGVLAFVVVSGAILVGLVYGVLARWALKTPAPPTRLPRAALAAGILAVASYVLFFTWAPFLVAPSALLLGREALRRERSVSRGRGRGSAIAGMTLGGAALAFGAGMVV